MKTVIRQPSPDEWHALGTSAAPLADPERIELPVRRAAQALSSAAVEKTPAAFERDYARVGSRLLEGTGIELGVAREPFSLCVSVPGSRIWSTASIETDPDDPETRYVQPRAPAFVRIECAGPRRAELLLYVDLESGALIVGRIERAAEIPPLAEVPAPPVSEWLQGWWDRWLCREAHARLRRRDSYQNAAAAGLVARCVLPPDAATGAAWLESTRRGEVVAVLAAPRRWARELGEEARNALVELALAEVDMLFAAIDDLIDSLDPESEEWRQELISTCERREALEGVQLLLHEAGSGERVAAAVAALDARGARFVRSIPVLPLLASELLERAAEIDDDSWWCAPVIG